MNGYARLYNRIYQELAGRTPDVRPWHFQWLAARYLFRDLRRMLPTLSGRVLDVGCGDKPYAGWLDSRRVTEHVGIDVIPGGRVDRVIEPYKSWPLETASFDAVLCTQVIEHVADLAHVISEIARVLKPGGTLMASIPFAYNQHAVPHDYRRLSVNGVENLLQNDFEVLKVIAEGGIGSTLAVFWLNWIEIATSRHRFTRFARAAALPAWLATSGLTNVAGVLLDALDKTGAFYGNTFVVARKRP